MISRTALAAAVAATLGFGLLVAGPADAASSKITYSKAKVVRWIDGDTVVTTKGTVRLIGVDTPERGKCGYKKAKKYANSWAPPGSTIKLGNPKSVANKDRYGRSLRYVGKSGKDISRAQIMKGSRARYDSRDGYQWHPRQARYRNTDAANKNYSCGTSSSGSSSRAYPPASVNTCPSYAPIKGNQGSPEWIYHLPGDRYYGVTNPEQCFATASAAEKAGYRAAKV